MSAQRKPATVFDLLGPDAYRRQLPMRRLVREALRLAWRAGRWELIAMLVVQLLTVVGIVVLALVTRELLSAVLSADRSNDGVEALAPELLLVVAITAALGVTQAIQQHRQRLLAELCSRYGEDEVLAVTGSVELARFDDPDFHDLVERALVAVRRLPMVVTGLTGVLRGVAGGVGAVVALLALAPEFVPVVAVVLVPLWLAGRRRGRAFHRFARSFTPEDRERRYLADLLSKRGPANEVRAFGLGGFLRARHAGLWDRRLAALRSVADRELLVTIGAGICASVVVGGTLLGLFAWALAGHVSLANAGAAALTVALLGQRVTGASAGASSLSESALFIDDYLELVEAAPPGREAPADPSPRREPSRVAAEDVTFSYAGARGPALHGVSLTIEPGEVVALVGENGSGKTTLAKLLAALYVPDGGRVVHGGVDTASGDRDALRDGVALIFQDFMRYQLPARENIGLGRAERLADEDAIHGAARAAGVEGALAALPEGYDTMLGPAFAGGTDLSLGQWQRVALARAIFRGAPFVILDEPTAALDARAEAGLFADVRGLLAGRSVLLISHRFSTVRGADRIHVMHGGEIVESGTHDELVDHGGRYAELFGMQAAPYR
ncbi:MAG: ABC transporter ATP-binding protein [Thermoleophilaceae bacterium]